MFIRDYFRVLVPLFVLFAAYHATVVPWLEPPPNKATTKWPTPIAPMRDLWWEGFFAEGDWQRDKEQSATRCQNRIGNTSLSNSRAEVRNSLAR